MTSEEILAAQAEAAAKEIRNNGQPLADCTTRAGQDLLVGVQEKWATVLEAVAAELRKKDARAAAMRAALLLAEKHDHGCACPDSGVEASRAIEAALTSNAGADFLAEHQRLQQVERNGFAAIGQRDAANKMAHDFEQSVLSLQAERDSYRAEWEREQSLRIRTEDATGFHLPDSPTRVLPEGGIIPKMEAERERDKNWARIGHELHAISLQTQELLGIRFGPHDSSTDPERINPEIERLLKRLEAAEAYIDAEGNLARADTNDEGDEAEAYGKWQTWRALKDEHRKEGA